MFEPTPVWRLIVRLILQAVCLLDWQICRYASPALDIAYFLCSSTDKRLRDAHLDELLRLYHANAARMIEQVCGTAAGDTPAFTFEQLHAELREYGRYGVLMAPILLQAMCADGEQIVDMDDMAGRLNGSELGKEEEMQFAQLEGAALERYRQRLVDVIDDALRWGWL